MITRIAWPARLALLLIAPSSCKQPEPAAYVVAYEIEVTSEPPGLHFHGNYSVWQPRWPPL